MKLPICEVLRKENPHENFQIYSTLLFQETHTGQVFNGKGSGQPAFVTPRVNASTSRRSSQGEGQSNKVSQLFYKISKFLLIM